MNKEGTILYFCEMQIYFQKYMYILFHERLSSLIQHHEAGEIYNYWSELVLGKFGPSLRSINVTLINGIRVGNN